MQAQVLAKTVLGFFLIATVSLAFQNCTELRPSVVKSASSANRAVSDPTKCVIVPSDIRGAEYRTPDRVVQVRYEELIFIRIGNLDRSDFDIFDGQIVSMTMDQIMSKAGQEVCGDTIDGNLKLYSQSLGYVAFPRNVKGFDLKDGGNEYVSLDDFLTRTSQVYIDLCQSAGNTCTYENGESFPPKPWVE